MVDDLFRSAENEWFALSEAGWIEAFGEYEDERSAPGPSDNRCDELKEAQNLYREKFGFIFIVSPTGRTADEMLAICRARLRNSVETELRIAAHEKWKIIEVRLTNTLEI